MTRIPKAGRVKTRLIPALGAEGAAKLHAALLANTLRLAERHSSQRSDVDVDVRFTGQNSESSDAGHCSKAVWLEQHEGDLGERMHGAISTAIDEGAQAVTVIGTDCPQLSTETLDRTWNLLEQHDVVLGPADDGGYYLLAVKQPDARLFERVTWGTGQVLGQTLDRCRELGKSVGLLPPLSDIDVAENLIVCRRIGSGFEGCLPEVHPGLLSVVIPTLNEAAQLAATVRPLLSEPECEIIIADGGSTDGTTELARELGCRVVKANRGRGKQLNAGAALARGESLLFLHADTQLPASFRSEMQSILDTGAIAGAFRFRIDQPGWPLRCIEFGTNLRTRLLQLPYGDQGLFLRSRDFFRIGGFRNWPIMEDFEFCRRLKTAGRIAIATSTALTSGRRWKRLGAVTTTLTNQACVAMYCCGVSPERISRLYTGNRVVRDTAATETSVPGAGVSFQDS
ncbi:DUF2064 domain-containing protein [bacterium]|nr:DUF2064 domain-containing protein [bacterium]